MLLDAAVHPSQLHWGVLRSWEVMGGHGTCYLGHVGILRRRTRRVPSGCVDWAAASAISYQGAKGLAGVVLSLFFCTRRRGSLGCSFFHSSPCLGIGVMTGIWGWLRALVYEWNFSTMTAEYCSSFEMI